MLLKQNLAQQRNQGVERSDGDGIPDYLDKEPSPAGAKLITWVELGFDGDGIPDLDKCPFAPGPASNNDVQLKRIKK